MTEDPDPLVRAADAAEALKALRVVRQAECAGATFDAIAEVALGEICSYARMAVGHLLITDAESEVSTPTDVWHLSGSHDYELLRTLSGRMSYAPGVDLPGRVVASRSPVVETDLASFRSTRWQSGCDLHVGMGWAVPILSPTRTLGVFEFFAAEGTPDGVDIELACDIAQIVASALERRDNAAAIERDRANLAALVNSTFDAFMSWDEEGRVVDLNETAERMFGWKRDEIEGRRMADTVVAPEALPTFVEFMAEGLRSGSGSHEPLESLARARDGSTFPVALTFWPLQGMVSAGPAFAAFVRDISKRKAAEDELRRSERRLRETLLLTGIGNWEWDVSTDMVWWSDELYAHLGWKTGTVEPSLERFLSVVHPADIDRVRAGLFAPILDAFSLEFRIVTPDGTLRWIRSHISPELGPDGRMMRLYGAVEDITTRKLDEQDTSWKAAMVTSSRDAIIGIDAEGVILSWNQAATELFGYTAAEIVGAPMRTLCPPDRIPEQEDLERRLAIGEAIERCETWRLRKEGTTVGVSISASPVSDADGRFDGSCVIVHDIGALVAARQERLTLLRHLVVAQEEERKVIAGDVHDDSIQEMTVVAIRLETLRRRIDDERALEAVAKLEGSVASAIARLRSLMFRLRPPALDDEGLVPALRQQLAATANDAGFEWILESELTVEPPVEVRVPAFRIAQEAITNARKHAHAKAVRVTVGLVDGGVRLEVADDGVGFAPAATPQPLGHLGVTSMRERAELVGGTFSIESAPGTGTRVEFWLPYAVNDAHSVA